ATTDGAGAFTIPNVPAGPVELGFTSLPTGCALEAPITTTASTTPEAVYVLIPCSPDNGDIVTGQSHSCGITPFGAAYCWRANESGQLGDGTTTQRLAPTAVTGGHNYLALEAGLGFTCGLTMTGNAYCWGDNSSGQLGDGTTTT